MNGGALMVAALTEALAAPGEHFSPLVLREERLTQYFTVYRTVSNGVCYQSKGVVFATGDRPNGIGEEGRHGYQTAQLFLPRQLEKETNNLLLVCQLTINVRVQRFHLRIVVRPARVDSAVGGQN